MLFPLSLRKVIFMDSDQIIRADVAELWHMDLEVSGNPASCLMELNTPSTCLGALKTPCHARQSSHGSRLRFL